MLEQFIRIEEHISKLEEVDTIRRGDVRKVKDIMKALADFESVMTDIQDAGVHIGEVRDNFQLMLLDYPELKDYIDADADITRNATFEKAVVKILNGQPGSLTLEEQQQVSQFVIPAQGSTMIATQDSNSKRNYAALLRERKRQKREAAPRYADLRFIAGTSASAERLFSQAKHILTPTRRNTSPVNFERLLFLKQNHFLWTASMVSQAIKSSAAELEELGLEEGDENAF